METIDTNQIEGETVILGMGHLGDALKMGLEQAGLHAEGQGRDGDPNKIRSAKRVILCMRPQQLTKEVAVNIGAHIDEEADVYSPLAGVGWRLLAKVLGRNVFRFMPNLAAKTGDSVTAVYTDDESADKSAAQSFIETWGTCIWLDSEDQFADFTALTACAVGLLARGVAKMEEEAILRGFSRENARKMANGTVRSLASLLNDDRSAAELADSVAVEGGATREGEKMMELKGVWERFILGTRAAADRTRALGELASKNLE